MGKSISSMFNVGDEILSIFKMPLYIPAAASILAMYHWYMAKT